MKKLILFVFLILGSSFATAQVVRYAKEFTRPANATAYTAGDAVCGTDSLPTLFFPAGAYNSAKILGALLMADTVNVANGTFTLFLYSDSLGLGKLADNAAFSPSITTDSLLAGYFDFTLRATGTASATSAYAFVTGTTNQVNYFSSVRLGVRQGLWGRLTATAAYVPKISGRFRIVLFVEEARR